APRSGKKHGLTGEGGHTDTSYRGVSDVRVIPVRTVRCFVRGCPDCPQGRETLVLQGISRSRLSCPPLSPDQPNDVAALANQIERGQLRDGPAKDAGLAFLVARAKASLKACGLPLAAFDQGDAVRDAVVSARSFALAGDEQVLKLVESLAGGGMRRW